VIRRRYYHTIIYLVLTLIGVRINVEISTNIGRIDAVIETNDNIYIFEFKMNSVNQAIKQIEEKNIMKNIF
jgi:ATP-dependent exoDNAse (exonuclease V) beta subunit